MSVSVVADVAGPVKVIEANSDDQVNSTQYVQPNVSKRAESVISRSLIDKQPDVANIMKRQYLYKRDITWDVGMAEGFPLITINSPYDLVNIATASNLPIRGLLEYHGYIRGSVEFEVKVNTTPFVSGQLVLTSRPSSDPITALSQSVELYPHSYLSVGHQTNAKLVAPFVSSHYAIVNPSVPSVNESQVFKTFVWNRLNTGTAQPASFEVSVWFRFVDVELGVKMPETASLSVYQSEESRTKVVKSSNVAGLNNTKSDYANVVTNVSKKAFDMRVLKKDLCDSTTYGQIDLKKYMQTYGRISITPWLTSTIGGTEIISLNTTLNQDDANLVLIGSGYQVPLLEVSRHFAFWRGSLKFKIQIVATRFHQGQLLVSWTPFGSCPNMDIATGTYYRSIDIGKQNEFEMEIPFLYPVDYARTELLHHGTIHVWVQNSLIAASTVSPNVPINVFMAAGDDFEFSTYRDPTLAVYQAETSSIDVSKGTIWKPLAVSSSSRLRRMQGHDDLTHFLRRPSHTFEDAIAATASATAQRFLVLPFIPDDAINNWPVRATLASGGVRWNVSVNLPLNTAIMFFTEITYDGADGTIVSSVSNYSHSSGIRSGRQYHHTHSTNERVVRFEVPMYLPAEYVSLFRMGDTLIPLPVLNVCFVTADTVNFNIHAYWEAGEDFQLHWPLSGPVRTIPALSDREERYQKKTAVMQGLVGDCIEKSIEYYLPYDYFGDCHCDELYEFDLRSCNFVPNRADYCCEVCDEINCRAIRECAIYDDEYISDTTEEWPELCAWEELYCSCIRPDVCERCEDVVDTDYVMVEESMCYPDGSEDVIEMCPKIAEMQGLDFFSDLFADMKNYLFNLKDRLVNGWTEFMNVFRAGAEAVKFITSASLWGNIIRDALGFLAKNLLPAISAIYAAWHSTGIIKLCALSQLAAMAFNISCPEKSKEDIEVKYKSKFVVAQGITEDLSDVSDVVSNVSRNFVKSVMTALGFSFTADYDIYIRRMTKGVKIDSWEYCIKTFGHSILYFLHGKSLNVEWQRKQLLPISEAISNYNLDNSAGLFTGRALDHQRNGKTNREILAQYFELTQSIFKLSTEFVIPSSFFHTVNQIKDAHNTACRNERTDASQPEPVGIFLCGAPGCGKSFFASTILPALVLAHTDIPSTKSLVYPYPLGEKGKFWDGYSQQPFILHDEFLQERDGGDVMDVVRNISSARPLVNMAALEEKGLTYDSPFYMCTSNEKTLNNVNTILCRDAVARRFSPFAFNMQVRPSYMRDGKLDAAKVSTEVDAIRGDDTVCQLLELVDKVWTFGKALTGVVMGADDYREAKTFIPDIAREYKLRKHVYYETKASTERLISRLNRVVVQNDDSDYEDCDLESVMTSTDSCPSVTSFLDNTFATSSLLTLRKDLNDLCDDMDCEDLSDPEISAVYFSRFKIIACCFQTHFKNVACVKTTCSDLTNIFPGEPEKVDVYRRLYLKNRETKPMTWMGLLKVLGMVGAVGTAIGAAAYGVSRLVKMMMPKLQSYTGDNALKAIKKVSGFKSVAKAVSLQSDIKYPDFHLAIHNNMVIVQVVNCETLQSERLNAICLDDRTLLCNTHLLSKYFKWAEAGYPVACVLTYKHKHGEENHPLRVEFGLTRRVSQNGIMSDLTVVHAPTPMQGMKNIWHLLATKNDFDNLLHKQYECYVRGGENTIHANEDVFGRVESFTSFLGAEGTFLEVFSDSKTIAGDCGRPYLLSKSSFSRPLIGLHACLSSDSIGAVPLIFENIRSARVQLPGYTHLEPPTDKMVKVQVQSHYWNSDIPIYTLQCNDQLMKRNCPNTTNLRPLTHNGVALKHPEWDCDMMPAALKPTDTIHPLISNSVKYEPSAIYCVDSVSHRIAVDHFTAKFGERSQFQRLYTTHESINGTNTMNRLQFSTGCGYWNLFGFKDGKNDFFESLPQIVDPSTGGDLPLVRIFSSKAKSHVVPLWNKTFVDYFNFCEEGIREGKLFTTFWISTNKDELRPAAKVAALKTRVFEQPGLEYTLLVRKYFGGFLDYFKSHSGFTFYHGIGQDKEVVWRTYYEELKKNSDYGHAFDYKNWDGSVSQDAFQFFEDVVNRFYDDKGKPECIARSCLLRILRDAHHIMGPYYFQSAKGNKSGNPFTDVFNSVCNFYVMSIAYLKCKVIAGFHPVLSDFDENVKMLTYGDDIIMSVKPMCLSYFKGPIIEDVLRQYGYVITDALKTGVIPDQAPLHELSFLKSDFVPYENVCLAPLPKKDIYKELCYAPKGSIGDLQDVRQRIENVCRFMSHHGPDDLAVFKRQLHARGIPNSWMTSTFDSFVEDLISKQNTASIY